MIMVYTSVVPEVRRAQLKVLAISKAPNIDAEDPPCVGHFSQEAQGFSTAYPTLQHSRRSIYYLDESMEEVTNPPCPGAFGDPSTATGPAAGESPRKCEM